MKPVIGITCDNTLHGSKQTMHYLSRPTYADAVWRAGGLPVLLPQIPDAIDEQLRTCDAVVLTGGDDPDLTYLGLPTHPAAKLMEPRRQQYELALIEALGKTSHPVLGICLGMQLMCLHHGGRLIQHLDEAALAQHRDADHAIRRIVPAPHILPESGLVQSHHHQAVGSEGDLHICALGPNDVIEAVEATGSRFYLGVQWHPERTADPAMGQHLFDALIAAVKR